jgi:hypothetical protein
MRRYGRRRPVEDTEALLAALDGTGIEVRAETNTRHRIGDGPLRIVTDGSAVPLHPDPNCIDGLDPRQWSLLRQLQRPGERLPLLLVSIETDAFRVMSCQWVGSNGTDEVKSFADVRRVVAEWDGNEPTPEAWNAARIALEARAREAVEQLHECAEGVIKRERKQQREAARLRLIEEPGRLLMCFPPAINDMNSKFYRLMSETTPTADRLKSVYNRLEGYPDWGVGHLAELRVFRNDLSPAQEKSQLTGRALDAALADPRWEIVQV